MPTNEALADMFGVPPRRGSESAVSWEGRYRAERSAALRFHCTAAFAILAASAGVLGAFLV